MRPRSATSTRDGQARKEKATPTRIETALREILPALIIRHRKAHGWTQEQLAEKTGLHWTTVGKMERGRLIPSLAVLTMLAESFGVPASRFFGAAIGETSDHERKDALSVVIDALPPIERERLVDVVRSLLTWRERRGG